MTKIDIQVSEKLAILSLAYRNLGVELEYQK